MHLQPRNQIDTVEDKSLTMDKLQLTGPNLGRVFNSRSGRVCVRHAVKLL